MDFRTEDELKLKKKLSSTAKKIWKNRRNTNKIKKEIQEFQEIRELLNTSEEGEESVASGKPSDSPVPRTTSITPPGIEIFNEDRTFWLFDEETLTLRGFLSEKARVGAFGDEGDVPEEGLFRDLIAHHVTETVLPDNESCHWVSLYVLYLMSVHADADFVCSCGDYLKHRRFEIIAGEILPIFINFGSSPGVLVGSDFPVGIPTNVIRSPGQKNGRRRFPYYNAEMVGNILLHYVALDLVKRETDVRLLLSAFTRLTLDLKIRSSRLFSVYSLLLSALSSRLIDTFGADLVADYLHLKEEHVLNQVEIARVVLMPISSTLHASLVARVINFILGSPVLKVSDCLRVQDVAGVLKNLRRRRDLTPLEVYCILQLINGSLPRVHVTTKQASEIYSSLFSLEENLFSVKDSVDVIRLKVEIAKLRNLVTNGRG